MEESYLDKNNDYFSIVRKDIISFIGNQKNLNVLEIGAGSGETLLELKKSGVANRISGFDLVDINSNKEKFDCFIIGNIENQESPFDNKEFDIIILADVLEHLIDPKKTIKKLIPSLRKEGSFYISLPNIRNYRALYKIFLKGNFEYEDSGIFDRTHLRFYCKKDMIQLLSSFSELEIVKIDSNLKYISSIKTTINKLTLGVFEEFLSLQYFIKAKIK